MTTPLSGQIRCPTCHRSTPPSAFCTQCGTPIPALYRSRPRGLDREELQDRIRTHRPGDAAFRRGSPAGEGYQGPGAYQPFQPEPEDELVIPGAEESEGGAARVDNLPAAFDEASASIVAPEAEDAPRPAWPVPPPAAAGAQPAAAAPPAAAAQSGPARAARAKPSAPLPPPPVAPPPVAPPPVAPPPVAPQPQPAMYEPEPRWSAPDDRYDADRYADRYAYRTADPNGGWDRGGSGISPLAVGGIVLLGVLAIGVGVLLSGLFSGGAAVASPTPSPTAHSSLAPSKSPGQTLAPTAGASVTPTPTAIGSPGTFPDGFTARAEPCAEQPVSQDGCSSSGASVTGGTVWAWVGWRKGNTADVLSVTIVNNSGASTGDGSIALGSIGCGDSCNGWAHFKFSRLAPGTYRIRVSRNDLPAAEATFTVTS